LIIEGHTAVGLFLFVSGFVFSFGAYGREVVFREFMRNRFLRIYPLFLFMLFLASVVYSTQFSLLPLIQTLMMFPEYPGGFMAGEIGGMFWSIGVEWKCYLLFPFLHRVTARKGLAYLVAFICLINLMRIGARYLGASPAPETTYFTLAGRLDQFCVGMLFGYRFAAGGLRWTKPATPLAMVLAVSTLFLYHRAGGWPAQDLWKVAWPTIEAAVWGLVVVGYIQVADAWTRMLRPLRWLGLISYSVYLVHLPILRAISDRRASSWPINIKDAAVWSAVANTMLLVLPIVVAIAVVTYLVIERPAMDLRRSYMGRGPQVDDGAEEPAAGGSDAVKSAQLAPLVENAAPGATGS
jgi:peptidoglycan/LPS O-acetylase OafA/YrhL